MGVISILKKMLRPSYYAARRLKIRLQGAMHVSRITDPNQIPIIINNRDRLTYMLQLIEFLESKGCRNIYIIDNDSSYPPLLEYYDTCPYKVFRLKENVGFLSLWKTGIYKQFINDYYVYSDSDVVPVEDCPDDFMHLFWNALKNDSGLYKAGFSLKIDDIPSYYRQRDQVFQWEQQYFMHKVSPLFYQANIDTTFAMYRPGMTGGASYLKSYRSAKPYEARHMPWYVDGDNVTEEERYYTSHAKTSTHWTKGNKN